jgi:hypothetical protein
MYSEGIIFSGMEFSSKKQHIQKESNQFRTILKSAFWQIFLSGKTILALLVIKSLCKTWYQLNPNDKKVFTGEKRK